MNYYCILPPAYGEKRTEKPASGLITDKNLFGVSLKGSIRILTFLTIAIFANDTMSYEAPNGNPSFCAVNFFPILAQIPHGSKARRDRSDFTSRTARTFKFRTLRRGKLTLEGKMQLKSLRS